MKFIARLMSHGFAIALVLLLAIGFMYRGELFPEWKLPEFLALDSAKDSAAGQPAGRIEPAPVRHEGMRPATATGGQAAAEMKAGAAKAGGVSGTLPLVDEVTRPATAIMAVRKPADAGASAMGRPPVVETTPGSAPADAGAGAMARPTVAEATPAREPFAAVEPAESETAAAAGAAGITPAAVDAGPAAHGGPAEVAAAESAEETRAGMPAPVTTAAVPAPALTAPAPAVKAPAPAVKAPTPAAKAPTPAAKAPPPAEVKAAAETIDLPATGRVRTSAGQAAVSTGAGEAGRALLEKTGAGDAARVKEAATDAMPGMAPATALPDIGASSESLRDTFATAAAPVKPATEAATARPAAEIPAMAAMVPAAPDMAAGAPAGTGSVTAPVATHASAPGSGLVPAPVSGADDAVVTGVIPPAAVAAAQGPEATTPAAAALSSYQLLALAREAYWMREYQAAEDFYREMILQDPDNPDGYGELANMYFSQGDWEAAASAYYEAGSRLVKSGLLASARELVDVIRGLEGPQADALAHEIETAQAESQ